MATVVRAVGIPELKLYAKQNPTKFAHKYGTVDFNNLPDGFEGKLAIYKMLVAKERSNRYQVGASQDEPAITPWTIFPKPVVAKVVPATPVETTTESNGETAVVGGIGITGKGQA